MIRPLTASSMLSCSCMMDPIKVALFTVAILSVLVEGDGVKLTEKQIVYIANVVEKFINSNGRLSVQVANLTNLMHSILGQEYCGVVHPPITFTFPPDPQEFLLPLLLLWHPVLTFRHIFAHQGLQCPYASCESVAELKGWNDGHTPHCMPRTLHDVKAVVLLVSAIYVCENGHKTLAHDTRVLEMITCPSLVPFVLLHQTGFTKEFVDLCTSMCHSGMNFHSLEAVIGKTRWQHHIYMKQNYESLVQQFQIFSASTECPCFIDFDLKTVPSDDLIAKCFLAKFLEDDTKYRCNIQSVDTGTSISFDHTFKVASNIGFLRKDRKWVNQYDSAFFVFNSGGKILSWQFTQGTSFRQVKKLLFLIQQRAVTQGNVINTVYIDNCCQWKRLLQEVFGEHLNVKLDLFHAVQRITGKMPKRHAFYSACTSDLRLVFRAKGDQGVKRTDTTPEATEILSNLESFTGKWRDVAIDNFKVLRDEALTEINKLKVHVTRGCLSGIPSSCGTNRNEAFHRYIRTFFHKSRLGLLLAYALMMIIVFHYNNNKGGKNIQKPIDAALLYDSTRMSLEDMGILSDDVIGNNTDATGTDFTKDYSSDTIELHHARDILTIGLSQLAITNLIQQRNTTANTLFRYLPYISPFKKPLCHDDSAIEPHEKRLAATLRSWNFILEPVCPDGNGFFTSIALNLIHNAEENLQRIGIKTDEPITLLVQKLRDILVREWLGPNRAEYCIWDHENFDSEANKFLEDGYYLNSLGDAMPLAMANALNSNIVIFRSTVNLPVTYVSPLAPSSNIIFISYKDCGPGHYDSVLYVGTATMNKLSEDTRTKCRCGVNAKDSLYQACVDNLKKHSSCKCLAARRSCSSECGCKGCKNPFGNRVMLGKRKRGVHKWQMYDTTSASISLDRGQTLKHGGWSKLESIIVTQVFRFIEREMMDLEADTIQMVYNCIVDYATAPHCQLVVPFDAILRKKSNAQVQAKLGYFKKEYTLFFKLQ